MAEHSRIRRNKRAALGDENNSARLNVSQEAMVDRGEASEQILAEARTCESEGEIVNALKLYKVAQKMLPSSDGLQMKIDRLEARVEQQLHEATASNRDMIHYMLTQSAKKMRQSECTSVSRPSDTSTPPLLRTNNDDVGTPERIPNDLPYAPEDGSVQGGREAKMQHHHMVNIRVQNELSGQLLDIINEGTEEEVMALYGIGPKRCDLILKARPVNSLKDLEAKGLKASVIERLRIEYYVKCLHDMR